jgi:hypothetical protein
MDTTEGSSRANERVDLTRESQSMPQIRLVAIALATVSAVSLPGCSDETQRYAVEMHSTAGVQVWLDTKTGASITCALMDRDESSCLYAAPFEKRAEQIALRELDTAVRESKQDP